MSDPLDDLGAPVPLTGPVRRVVSLVPSLTEAVASVEPGRLVGATDWCTHPAQLAVTRVRGTKNPDLAAIAGLSPDLVIANQEENRELDVRRLREAGISVWVTRTHTVPEAIDSITRLLTTLAATEPGAWVTPAWLTQARARWCGALPPVTRRIAIAIWKDPWMVVGPDTFTSDLARRLGWGNVFAGHPDRYPKLDVAELDASGAEVILLPDEPYLFTAEDGPGDLSTPTELVSGRLLTWYGPSLIEAADL